MINDRAVVRLMLGSLLFKLLLAGITPLFDDEAYYWVWGHHLSLSYFDHPPMVAWLFWLGQPLEGLGHAVRFPAIIFGHFGIWIFALSFSQVLLGPKLFWAVALLLVHPLVGGAVQIVTPDLPMMTFYALGFWWLQHLVIHKSLANFAVFGLILGLGFVAKYPMALFGLTALLWGVWARRIRLADSMGVLVAMVCCIVAALPVFVWNAQHNFDSFLFQLDHGLGTRKPGLMGLPLFLLTQVVLLTPVLAWAAGMAFSRANPAMSAYRWFALLPVVFFGYASTQSPANANWIAVAYPFLIPLAVSALGTMRWVKLTVGFWAILLSVVFAQAIWRPLPQGSAGPRVTEIYRFEYLTDALVARDRTVPLFAGRYQDAARLSYDLQLPVYKLAGVNRRDHYDYLSASTPSIACFDYLEEGKGDREQWALERGLDLVDRQVFASHQLLRLCRL